MTLSAGFAAAMSRLGPFEPSPRLAAAVSGGADSMALALLVRDWVAQRGGSVLALVVDHGLRPESAAEADATLKRLEALRIPARLLCLNDLPTGPAMAERARIARYAALRTACRADGRLHLLLGHHAADQAETVLIRRDGGSGPNGLAAMSALTELPDVRLLRPLLALPPGRLRDFLRAAGVGWVEDPSNRDTRALRPRLRAWLGDPEGAGPTTTSLAQEANAAGVARAERESKAAATLAARVALYPEGYALLAPGRIDPAAFAALIQTVSGAPYPPPAGMVAPLAEAPRSATLAGVQLMPADRLGDAWLMLREAAAMDPPVPAEAGTVWDGRFRLSANSHPPDGAVLGALGSDAARLRHLSPLPAAVLRTLPAVRHRNLLVAVPHLTYRGERACAPLAIGFGPRRPAAGAGFLPA